MSATVDVTRTIEFGQFLEFTKKIGSDILKTQGAGGNTSFKSDGTMWVKASGTWLAHAGERDIMVPVVVEPLVEALRQGDPRGEKSTDFVVTDLNTSGLRPSIETSFHAALKNPVVAHYHCVNTIALAVLERREEIVAERMKRVPDLTWETIPYRRPGTPLAREIEAVADKMPDVLVLFNHGVIVAGASVDQVAERVDRVTAALLSEPRKTPPPDLVGLATIAEGSEYHPAADEGSHATALCPVSMSFAVGGSMYPDHVIFLGTEIGVLTDGMSVAELVQTYRNKGLETPKMLVLPGKGVLLSGSLTQGGEAMARCLAEVVTRIPEREKIAYFSEDEEYELTHWEAEQYRQALDRKAAGKTA
jgi:rhamnose utilization protein RhaD (predicted bifunctional aldolase and dehydrogenase)